jgi:adenosine deaminase
VARIELHTHLEGSVTPTRLIDLADRHGQPGLPAECLDEAGTAYRFEGFHGFLQLYRHVTRLLKTPADFHAVALDLGRQLAADEVEYAEVTLSYGVMLRRAIDPLPIQRALAEAAALVAESEGVTMRWIPDAVRQWGVDEAWRAWEKAATAGRELGVVGFGLGGDETDGPARNFARLFAEVRGEGFGATIHAGEVPSMGAAGADSARQAVEECGAMRIGHGLAAAADPLVMATLAARGTFVELCPGSNLATGALENYADHPLRAFLEAGIPCCLNTDDRTLFGLDLEGEYGRATAELGLTSEEAARMQEQASDARFKP